MKNLTKNLIILGSIILSINSCAPAYVPNVLNVPLFSKKGEIQLAVNTGTAGFDPQVAYAITDHVGVMLNGSFSDRTFQESNDYHRHNFLEFGTGYYTKLEENIRVEVFVGAGNGNVVTVNNTTINANLTRFFIQPSIGYSSNYFDFSFTTRLAAVNVKTGSIGNTNLFIEPVLTTKFGSKYVKGMLQFGLSLPTKSPEFNFLPFMLSVGLQIKLNQ